VSYRHAILAILADPSCQVLPAVPVDAGVDADASSAPADADAASPEPDASNAS